jgi:hypothetical protein
LRQTARNGTNRKAKARVAHVAIEERHVDHNEGNKGRGHIQGEQEQAPAASLHHRHHSGEEWKHKSEVADVGEGR